MNPTHDSLLAKEDVDHSDVFFPGIVLVAIDALDLNDTALIVIITMTRHYQSSNHCTMVKL